MTENALIFDNRFASCINVTFNKALPLPRSMCFGTTRVAQWINLLPTQYIPQNQRSLVLIFFVPTWSLPPWASSNDELFRTLREVKQLAHSRAEAVADWISEQESARQTLDDASSKGVTNQISIVTKSGHVLSVVALAIALAALVIAIATFVTVNPKLRLLYAAIAAILFCGQLRCSYTDRTEDAANQVKVVSELKGKHKRIEYRARLTRNQTLETLETQVTLILHTTGKARLDYSPQQLTEFIYGSVRRGLLITEIVKCTITSCDCSFNFDIEVAITSLWPTATIFTTTADQVDPDATLTHS